MNGVIKGAGAIAFALILSCSAAEAANDQCGQASWYGPGFDGRIAASGERFDEDALTAAHRSLPFGTRVRVQNLSNGRTVVVVINDRGPYVGGRVIDLSRAAAAEIGMIQAGVTRVRISIVGGGADLPGCA